MASIARRFTSAAHNAFLRSSLTRSIPCVTVPCRNASFQKIGKADVNIKTKKVYVPNAETQAAAPAKVPYLNDVLRNLWKRIHPDLMVAYPVQREVNEQSLMTLQGLLTALKDTSGDNRYPRIANAVLVFYLRGDKPGHVRKAELLLHTTGTACKDIIQKQLETFFQQTGLATTFKWDAEYFPFKGVPTARDLDAEAAAEHQNANYHETYEEFQARILREQQGK